MNQLIALCLLLISSVASAGQLHYDYLQLGDVPKQAGYALAVLVMTVNAARRNVRLRVRIKQRWGTVPSALATNEEVEVELNPGVDWVDPHVSPIERRVQGFLHNVEANSEIVLVPLSNVYDALPGGAETRRKLDLFFAPAGVSDYQQKYPLDGLVRDLRDEDLAPLAYDALRARHLLRADQLLDLPPHLVRQRVSHHLGKVAASERADFLRAAAKRLAGHPYDDFVSDLVRLLYDLPLETAELAPLAAFLDTIDLSSERATGDFVLVKDKLVQRLQAPEARALAGLFVGSMVRFALHRPRYRSEDPGTSVYLALLDPAAQVRAVRELLAGENAAPHFDEWIYEVAMRFAIETPARDYLPSLAALDLSRIGAINHKAWVIHLLLRFGLRLCEREPAALPAVRSVLDPRCADADSIRYLLITSPDGKQTWERYQQLIKGG